MSWYACHIVGNLGDEYFSGAANYTGVEPGNVNLTINTNRNTLKWRDFVNPTTPIPTALANITDQSQDAGVFPGATIGQNQFATGLFRPAWNARMNSNALVFCPVCYNRIHNVLDPLHFLDGTISSHAINSTSLTSMVTAVMIFKFTTRTIG